MALDAEGFTRAARSTKNERRGDDLPGEHLAGAHRRLVAVYLMASTGLRLSECLGLTVDRVDFLRRTLRVDRQLVAGEFGPTKPGPACAPFRSAPRSWRCSPRTWQQFPAGPLGTVFTMPKTRETAEGAPVNSGRWAETYLEACRAAGLKVAPGRMICATSRPAH